jgi:hypothetical protein
MRDYFFYFSGQVKKREFFKSPGMSRKQRRGKYHGLDFQNRNYRDDHSQRTASVTRHVVK